MREVDHSREGQCPALSRKQGPYSAGSSNDLFRDGNPPTTPARRSRRQGRLARSRSSSPARAPVSARTRVRDYTENRPKKKRTYMFESCHCGKLLENRDADSTVL